ncbi:MAG: glycosyltransferase, partial [Methanobacteriaceae archaeon]
MSDKKKILMIGQFPPHIGGVGVHIHSLAKAIVKRGDEVDVLTYPHNDIKDIYIDNNTNNDNTTHINNTNKKNSKNKIKVHGTFGINICGLRSLFFTLSGTIKAINLIRKNKIDIIHGHYLFPSGLVAVLAGKITKTPVFVTAHGSDMFCLYKQHSFMRPVVKYVLK